MTCDCISVEYPSARLLPLVNVAIENQSIDLKLAIERNDERNSNEVKFFNSLSSFKKWWMYNGWDKNADGSLNVEYMHQRYDEQVIKGRLLELNNVRRTAEYCDTVRLSGDCLARIDKWAGN